MNQTELLAIMERIANGEHSEIDIEILRKALSNEVDRALIQVGKYNISIGQGSEEIHIGDRTFVEIDSETMNAIATLVESQISDSSTQIDSLLLPVVNIPPFLHIRPKKSQKRWITTHLSRQTTTDIRQLLAWCSLCSYFNKNTFKEICHQLNHNMAFVDDLWHWIIDLEISEVFGVNSDFYRIKPKFQALLVQYTEQKATHSKLASLFGNYAQKENDPQQLYLYKAGTLIHQIYSGSSDIDEELISRLLDVFRYEKEVKAEILEAVSKQKLYSKKTYAIYQTATLIPYVDPSLMFAAAVLLEKISSLLIRFRLSSVYPLRVSALIYQTWSNYKRSTETFKLAISNVSDRNSLLAGELRSRLALNHVMQGEMKDAKDLLYQADTNLRSDDTKWLDNQLNKQIFLMKMGAWEESLNIGLVIEPAIKEPYLKAKHAHILGVNYLYLGNLESASIYAFRCKQLSNLVSLSSWVLGKPWRNRFSYALLSSIDLVRGTYANQKEREVCFDSALRIAGDTIRQLNPISSYFFGRTINSHELYTEAFVYASRQDYIKAEEKYVQLQQSNYLETYYRIASKIDLATIFLKTNRIDEALSLFQSCADESSNTGFQYLELRAIRKISALKYDQSMNERQQILESSKPHIGGPFIDSMEYLIPV